MSETDDAPVVESNHSDVKSRIDDLIARPPQPEKEEAVVLSDEDTTPVAETPERDALGMADDEFAEDETEDLENQEEIPEEVATLDAKQLAEKLDIPIDELYSMKFPYGENGESITLGELKDSGIRAKGIDAESESLSQERDSFINDRMKSRSELQNIVSLLPEIPQELMQQAQHQQALTQQRERVSLLATIPEWSDPGVEQPARQAIMENISQYGFTETEASYMMDHRLVKLLHDFTRLRQKLVAPKAQLTALKKTAKGKPKSRQTRRGRDKERAIKIGRTDTRGAINALLPRE